MQTTTPDTKTAALDDDLRRRVLYCDSNLLILNKPAGLAVHPGTTTTDSLEQHMEALRFGLARPPALAHRLDRDTSGCLVLGRQHKALRRLGRLFATGRIEKTYWAVVCGQPPADRGQVTLALTKRLSPSGWRMVPDAHGQAAVTDYRVLARCGGLSWLELHPRSGRTHQIRVHCASGLGVPVLGDPVYGIRGAAPDTIDSASGSGAPAVPLHLHARAVTIPPLASTRPPVTAIAPLPPHMEATLAGFGFVAPMQVGAACKTNEQRG